MSFSAARLVNVRTTRFRARKRLRMSCACSTATITVLITRLDGAGLGVSLTAFFDSALVETTIADTSARDSAATSSGGSPIFRTTLATRKSTPRADEGSDQVVCLGHATFDGGGGGFPPDCT